MNKFYALATNKENKNFVVNVTERLYPAAQREAKEKCKEEGLTFQDLRLIGSKQDNGATLTKFAKGRKQSRRGEL